MSIPKVDPGPLQTIFESMSGVSENWDVRVIGDLFIPQISYAFVLYLFGQVVVR